MFAVRKVQSTGPAAQLVSTRPGSPKTRRRLIACTAAALAVSAGAPMTYALLAKDGTTIPRAAAAASSFLKEMMNRSPGARNGAELVKSKGERVSAVLSSAVLPKEKTAAVLPTGIVSMANPAPPAIDVILPGSVAPLPFGPIVPPTSFNFPPPGGGGGGGSFPPPGGGFTPPGGGGGFTPPGLNPPPVPPPVPPVPEPSTWATMLLGFALTGWAVRRRPRRVAKRAVAAQA